MSQTKSIIQKYVAQGIIKISEPEEKFTKTKFAVMLGTFLALIILFFSIAL